MQSKQPLKQCEKCNNTFLSYKKTSKFCSRRCYELSIPQKIEKECKYCHKKMFVKSYLGNKQIYCSKSCMNLDQKNKYIGTNSHRYNGGKTLKICLYCNKDFLSYDKSKKYCSKKCYSLDQKNKRTKENNPNYKGIKSIKKCIVCNKEFIARIKTNKYCSKKCSNIDNGKKHLKEKHHNYKGVGKIKICIACGTQFFTKTGTGIYCSKKCSNINNGKKLSGVNSPSYIDGRTPKVDAIRKNSKGQELTKQVIKRDNYSCVLCGSNKILHADHIIPFSKIYSKFIKLYPKNINKEELVKNSLEYKPFWDISNLRTLCKKCHNIRHKKYKQQELKLV